MHFKPRLELIAFMLLFFTAGCNSIGGPGRMITATPTPSVHVRSDITPIPLPSQAGATPTSPPASPTPTAPVFREDISPSAIQLESRPTQTAPAPSTRPAPLDLTEEGPWLLYCDEDGQAALANLDGSGGHKPGTSCFTHGLVSGEIGFGFTHEGLIQLPGGEIVGGSPGEPSRIGWSPDGRFFVLVNDGLIGGMSELIVFDRIAARARQGATSEHQIIPMGWSPSGDWLVFSEAITDLEVIEQEGLLGRVFAIAPEGSPRRELYEIRSGDYGADTIQGWVSDTSFVAARSVEWCDLSLMQANVITGETEQVYGLHAHAAVDPDSGTVLLFTPGPGTCAGEDDEPGLVRLTASGDWRPQRIDTPAAWGTDWGASRIAWFPSLGRFGVWLESGAETFPETWAGFILVSPMGQISLELTFEAGSYPRFLEVAASPDGRWMVVSGTRPFGTYLYDAHGRLITKLTGAPMGDLAWIPNDPAFFMVVDGGERLVRASREQNWDLITIDSQVSKDSRLEVVSRPERTGRPACQGLQSLEYTYLEVGDAVYSSFEPNLPSRLRAEPNLDGNMIGLLNPGDQAVILDGPACADGFIWWRVRSERTGLSGWTAEGDHAGAWLLPNE